MAKEERGFDIKNFLIGKLRSASRKVPVFNEALKAAKVAVKVEYTEGNDYVTVTPLEGPDKNQSFFVAIHKKAQNRDRVMFRCAECGRLFFGQEWLPSKKGLKKTNIMAIDHIKPVVDPRTGFVDWNTYIDRMFFMGAEGLQILCNYPGERDGKISCHHAKTAKEKGISAQIKRVRDIMDKLGVCFDDAVLIDTENQLATQTKKSKGKGKKCR